MSDEIILDEIKAQIRALDARTDQEWGKIEILEKELNDLTDQDHGTIQFFKKRIEALEKRLETRIDTQHDSDMRSLDIIGINELDIRHIKSVLKKLIKEIPISLFATDKSDKGFEKGHEFIISLIKELSGEKDVFESSKMIMHCFCCGTDITDETNCFCLKCFNDKIAHDIKKDMVISRELFGEVQDFMGLLGHSNDNDVIDAKYAKNLYMKLKEVEKS